MQFEFATASRIVFGPGRINLIGNLASEYGNRAMVISGCPKAVSDRLINLLDERDIFNTFVKIDHEPTINSVRELVDLALQFSPELVIGIGGGSTIDSAKTTAALLSNPGDVTDYLEVVGANKPIDNPSIPLIAIPTTSGTGSEVTRNAVLGSPTYRVKVSLRSHYLLPKISLIDPELMISVPQRITATTGLDTLTQLIEPYTCNVPNPLTDSLCLEGIQRVARSLYIACDHGDDLPAREDMALASLFSGLALANAKLGAVHGLAGPIGGEIPAPHGAICAILLPTVMAANLKALSERDANNTVRMRYEIIGKTLSRNPNADAIDGIKWVRKFCDYANIRGLSGYGLTKNTFTKLVDDAIQSSSMKGNPIQLTQDELRNILERSL